jgi:hypothetical protein
VRFFPPTVPHRQPRQRYLLKTTETAAMTYRSVNWLSAANDDDVLLDRPSSIRQQVLGVIREQLVVQTNYVVVSANPSHGCACPEVIDPPAEDDE